MQIKSLRTYTQQGKVEKKQGLLWDKNTIPCTREGSCSLEKQYIDILVQIKLIFNSVVQGDFDLLFDPGVEELLQLSDESIYLKVVSYINPNFRNVLTMVQNFQTFFENFALVNMSKLVISKPNISKTDISYLLKCTLMCTFQEVTNFIFKVYWFTFMKINSLELFKNFEGSQKDW